MEEKSTKGTGQRGEFNPFNGFEFWQPDVLNVRRMSEERPLTLDNDQAAIEQEFAESWASIHKMYETLVYKFKLATHIIKPTIGLVADLRRRGYDKQFRAVVTMDIIVISRSLNSRLRQGQPSITIRLKREGGMSITYVQSSGSESFEFDRIELNDELKQLLARLREHPID